jgi:hypothetical protein
VRNGALARKKTARNPKVARGLYSIFFNPCDDCFPVGDDCQAIPIVTA